MLKCEICYDWCSRIEITRQWWDIARNDWNSLNGRDLPYYVAVLAVLRETTKEIFRAKSNHRNHGKEDERGYGLISNENCEFVPLTELQKTKWKGLCLTIRAFRNGAAHISYVENMNPVFLTEPKDPEDALQDYYRYAPFPYLTDRKRKRYSDCDLEEIHGFVKQAILSDVRNLVSSIPSHRIGYEFHHVERSPFIDLLFAKMIELLEEVKVW